MAETGGYARQSRCSRGHRAEGFPRRWLWTLSKAGAVPMGCGSWAFFERYECNEFLLYSEPLYADILSEAKELDVFIVSIPFN
jgi:hypothetical protein